MLYRIIGGIFVAGSPIWYLLHQEQEGNAFNIYHLKINFIMISCLLIDDDPDEYEIFSLALKHIDEPHSCRPILDAEEAIALLENDRSFTPEFIFIDINMPGISGVECLDRVKRIYHLDDIPVIMYSNSSNQNDIMAAKELGASHYFIKPVRMGVLSQTLSRLFQREPLPFILP